MSTNTYSLLQSLPVPIISSENVDVKNIIQLNINVFLILFSTQLHSVEIAQF